MKTALRLLVFVCSLAAAAWAAELQPGTKVSLVAQHPDGVPVRDQPGASRYDRWPDGTEAIVVVDTGNWIQVEAGGKKVWLLEKYLKAGDGSSTVTTGNEYLYADAPTRTTYPQQWVILTNIGYESAYDETFKNPAWVAYHLSGTPQYDVNPRPSGYVTDDRTTSKVTEDDYPSGYDHGHMAPNNAIGLFFGDQAQGETFLMTNMLPQRHGLNAGPWKTVETAEYSRWVAASPTHEIWVICGPVYTTTDDQPVNPTDRRGQKQFCIPVACFKIVMTNDVTGHLQTLAFIMPEEGAAGIKPAHFLTSIREIERRTGLNFFAGLPQNKQDDIETRVAAKLW